MQWPSAGTCEHCSTRFVSYQMTSSCWDFSGEASKRLKTKKSTFGVSYHLGPPVLIKKTWAFSAVLSHLCTAETCQRPRWRQWRCSSVSRAMLLHVQLPEAAKLFLRSWRSSLLKANGQATTQMSLPFYLHCTLKEFRATARRGKPRCRWADTRPLVAVPQWLIELQS